jgi:DNA (cytosine-5)-methyltransferase 1
LRNQTQNKSHKELFFGDLFAGCGGLSLGLEQSGFKPVFVNELNEDALATYQVNRESDFL